MARFSSFSLLVGLLFLVGCVAERSSQTSEMDASRVALAEVLSSASLHRDDGSLAVLDRLGEPRRIEAEPVANRHVEGQTDTLRTYVYDGLALEVYAVTGGGELLQMVRVTGPGYETAEGLRVGSTREAVREALGAPHHSGDDVLTYESVESPDDPTPTTLTVRFDGDRVATLAWSFYVD